MKRLTHTFISDWHNPKPLLRSVATLPTEGPTRTAAKPRVGDEVELRAGKTMSGHRTVLALLAGQQSTVVRGQT